MPIYVYVHTCIYTHTCVYGDREKVHRGRRHRKKNLLTQKVLRHLYINMQKKKGRNLNAYLKQYTLKTQNVST